MRNQRLIDALARVRRAVERSGLEPGPLHSVIEYVLGDEVGKKPEGYRESGSLRDAVEAGVLSGGPGSVRDAIEYALACAEMAFRDPSWMARENAQEARETVELAALDEEEPAESLAHAAARLAEAAGYWAAAVREAHQARALGDVPWRPSSSEDRLADEAQRLADAATAGMEETER